MNNTEKLINVFSNALGINKEKVNEQLSYQSVKQWDSMAHMVLVAEIEDSFNINIQDKDITQMDTFGNTRNLLEKYNVQFD
ncbi:acyl carrier protein [Solitalea sp. MAHUQ-68]|uniref:Acyl carrier protein n=1 Tax=Solitalea agri TaxID=2953739 RepID=A0A9X2JD18_9SPHI|nr:acyl carrier protein [Solitalea agri]MCO4293663.1 acyl carrier protein [Solitalea agri]